MGHEFSMYDDVEKRDISIEIDDATYEQRRKLMVNALMARNQGGEQQIAAEKAKDDFDKKLLFKTKQALKFQQERLATIKSELAKATELRKLGMHAEVAAIEQRVARICNTTKFSRENFKEAGFYEFRSKFIEFLNAAEQKHHADLEYMRLLNEYLQFFYQHNHLQDPTITLNEIKARNDELVTKLKPYWYTAENIAWMQVFSENATKFPEEKVTLTELVNEAIPPLEHKVDDKVKELMLTIAYTRFGTAAVNKDCADATNVHSIKLQLADLKAKHADNSDAYSQALQQLYIEVATDYKLRLEFNKKSSGYGVKTCKWAEIQCQRAYAAYHAVKCVIEEDLKLKVLENQYIEPINETTSVQILNSNILHYNGQQSKRSEDLYKRFVENYFNKLPTANANNDNIDDTATATANPSDNATSDDVTPLTKQQWEYLNLLLKAKAELEKFVKQPNSSRRQTYYFRNMDMFDSGDYKDHNGRTYADMLAEINTDLQQLPHTAAHEQKCAAASFKLDPNSNLILENVANWSNYKRHLQYKARIKQIKNQQANAEPTGQDLTQAETAAETFATPPADAFIDPYEDAFKHLSPLQRYQEAFLRLIKDDYRTDKRFPARRRYDAAVLELKAQGIEVPDFDTLTGRVQLYIALDKGAYFMHDIVGDETTDIWSETAADRRKKACDRLQEIHHEIHAENQFITDDVQDYLDPDYAHRRKQDKIENRIKVLKELRDGTDRMKDYAPEVRNWALEKSRDYTENPALQAYWEAIDNNTDTSQLDSKFNPFFHNLFSLLVTYQFVFDKAKEEKARLEQQRQFEQQIQAREHEQQKFWEEQKALAATQQQLIQQLQQQQQQQQQQNAGSQQPVNTADEQKPSATGPKIIDALTDSSQQPVNTADEQKYSAARQKIIDALNKYLAGKYKDVGVNAQTGKPIRQYTPVNPNGGISYKQANRNKNVDLAIALLAELEINALSPKHIKQWHIGWTFMPFTHQAITEKNGKKTHSHYVHSTELNKIMTDINNLEKAEKRELEASKKTESKAQAKY